MKFEEKRHLNSYLFIIDIFFVQVLMLKLFSFSQTDDVLFLSQTLQQQQQQQQPGRGGQASTPGIHICLFDLKTSIDNMT